MRARGALVAIVTALVLAVWIVPAGAETTTVTMKDTFKAQAYGGNEGDTDFSGPWREIGESTDPVAGFVQVADDNYCSGNYCVMIGGQDDDDDDSGTVGLYRQADLEGASLAKLCFDWGRRTSGGPGGVVTAEISPDGGKSWVVLTKVEMDRSDGGLRFHEEIDITEWAGAETQIRFMTYEGPLTGFFVVDDVEIQAELESETTTTTTKPETTTTTKPGTTTTTTTTRPETTTTTTTRPETTTTTTKPNISTTTTTKPDTSTTSTTEAPTTTTTTSPTTTTTLPPDFGEVPPPPPNDPPPPPGDASPTATEVPTEMTNIYMKDDLARTASMPVLMVPGMDDGDSPGDGSSGHHHPSGLSPVEGLTATFTASAESLGGSAVTAILLGILIAALAVRGVRDRSSPDFTN